MSMDPIARGLAVKAGAFKGARVSNGSAQSIANTTTTALTADTESFDVGACHSTSSNTSRLTAPVAGYYLATACVLWASNTTGLRVLELRANGSDLQGKATFDPDGSALDPNQNTSAVYYMAAGEYVEATVWQNSGGALNCTLSAFTLSLLGI